MALPHYGGKNSMKNYGYHGEYHGKPKNYSRKISKDGFICSCLCPIVGVSYNHPGIFKIFEKVMIKYETEPKNGGTNFKKITELPEIFSKLLPEDYQIKNGRFTRDNIQVPFVYEIEILAIEKYIFLKNKENRRNKLNKINLL